MRTTAGPRTSPRSTGWGSTSGARSSSSVTASFSGASRSATPRSAGRRGLLIYSDPADDGYARGDVYPNGPYRPPSSLQRGSVQFLSLGPGDPSTPDLPSIKGVKRLPFDVSNGFTIATDSVATNADGIAVRNNPVKDWEKATGLVREDYFATIPSLPVSYEAARPILAAMGGPNVPAGWQGGLPLPYHVGPGPTEVHFAIAMDYKVRTVWNVIATIKGSAEPDRWVMIGNHRDAWVYGAVDPSSGTAATPGDLPRPRRGGQGRLEAAAGRSSMPVGTPRSTAWSGRPSGPTSMASEIDQKAVMMLNVDSAVAGQELDLDGIPSMRDFLLEAAGSVQDVRSGRPLRDAWMAKRRAAWARGDARGRRPDLGRRLGAGRPLADVLAAAQRAGLGVGLHGLRRPSGRPGDRRRIHGALWGLSFDLR